MKKLIFLVLVLTVALAACSTVKVEQTIFVAKRDVALLSAIANSPVPQRVCEIKKGDYITVESWGDSGLTFFAHQNDNPDCKGYQYKSNFK